MKPKYLVIPTADSTQSLLTSVATRPDSAILPAISVQLPTEVANELANAANRQTFETNPDLSQVINERALLFVRDNATLFSPLNDMTAMAITRTAMLLGASIQLEMAAKAGK